MTLGSSSAAPGAISWNGLITTRSPHPLRAAWSSSGATSSAARVLAPDESGCFGERQRDRRGDNPAVGVPHHLGRRPPRRSGLRLQPGSYGVRHPLGSPAHDLVVLAGAHVVAVQRRAVRGRHPGAELRVLGEGGELVQRPGVAEDRPVPKVRRDPQDQVRDAPSVVPDPLGHRVRHQRVQRDAAAAALDEGVRRQHGQGLVAVAVGHHVGQQPVVHPAGDRRHLEQLGVELVQGEARQVTDQVVRGRGQHRAAGLDRGRTVLDPRGRAEHQRERQPARPAADRRARAGVVDTVVAEHLVGDLCVERRHPEPGDQRLQLGREPVVRIVGGRGDHAGGAGKVGQDAPQCVGARAEVAQLVDQHQQVAVRKVGEQVGESRPGGDQLAAVERDHVVAEALAAACRLAQRGTLARATDTAQHQQPGVAAVLEQLVEPAPELLRADVAALVDAARQGGQAAPTGRAPGCEMLE